MFNRRFVPLDDKDLQAVISFYRNRARDYKTYADNLENGNESDLTDDVVKMFQQQSDWFNRWIKFLKEV